MPEQHNDPLFIQYLAMQQRAFSCPGCGDSVLDLLPTAQDFRKPPLQHAIASLTPVERDSLSNFLRPLITESHFGYVIFGSKPMALGAVVADELKERLNAPSSRAYRSDFNLWNSLASHFPERRLQIHEFAPLEQGGASEVMIFHPERIARIVNERLDLFKEAFGEAIDGQGMCARVLASSSREEAFTDRTGKVREDLLGLLLGFPKQSVLGFQDHQRSADTSQFFGEPSIQWSAQRSSITPVKFRADPCDPEARAVVERFEVERRLIEDIMSKPSWLERGLQQIFRDA